MFIPTPAPGLHSRRGPSNMENKRLYDASGIADVIGTLGNTAANIIGAFKGPNETPQEAAARVAAANRPQTNWTPILLIGGVIAALVAVVLIFKK